MSVTDKLSTRSIAIALALTVLLSAGVAFAAVPTVDTSTTDDTSTKSDITAGHTFNLSDSTDNGTLQYQADSNNSKVEITTVVDGENETVFENSSAETVVWNSTDNDGHFNVTIEDSDLADVPSAIDGNTTVTVKITNNTSAENPDVKEFTAYVERGDNRSVVMLGSGTASSNDDVTVTNESGTEIPVVDMTLGGTQSTDLEFERNVSSNTDEVVVILADDDASDQFSSNFEGLESASAHSAISAFGDDGVIAQTDGEYVKAYDSELPSDLDADTTAVTYEQVGGQDALVFDVSESEDTATVSAKSGAGMGAYLNAYTFGGSLTLGVLIIFGSTRINRGE